MNKLVEINLNPDAKTKREKHIVCDRFAEHIPYELLRYLSSELFKFPFEKPFPHQNPDPLGMSLYLNRGDKVTSST